MDVARLNMSHGTHDDHRRRYDLVRQASDATGHGVGIIADLQGPKIRLETFAGGKAKLAAGDEFVITTRDVEGDATICGTTYKGLPGDVAEGDPILVDDGKLRLRVVKVEGPDVTTRVEVGGKVSDHKGLNLPGRRGQRARPCRRRTSTTCAGRCGPRSTSSRCPSCARRPTSRTYAGSCARRACCCPSSPRSRSRRRSTTSTRSSRPSTRSWSPAATSAWSARSRTCRSCRSGSSTRPAATPSR